MQALSAMVLLPSYNPEDLGESTIPAVIQKYIKAVSVCFASPSLQSLPSVLPEPIDRSEVEVMMDQLEIALDHTSLLLLSEGDSETVTDRRGRVVPD